MNFSLTHSTDPTRRGILSRIVLAILLFLLLQALAAGILVQTGKSTSNAILFSTVANILFTILAWKWLKILDLRHAFALNRTFSSRNGYAVTAGLTGAACCIFFCNTLTELLQIPDQMEDLFREILKTPTGIVSVGIITPIFEELIFREGIEGYLLDHGCGHWRAIIVSAITFSLMHMNPAQSFFAFIMGMVLGILYWKTRNIWLCGLVHIANNSLAVALTCIPNDELQEMTFSDLLGGTLFTTIFALLSALLSWMLLNYFCRQFK